MKVEAIVYSSMTGFTAQYAKMLAQKTGIPAYELSQANQVKAQAPVLYMSWLMAGTLVDYRKAAAQLNVVAACSVGLNATAEQVLATKKSTKIPDAVPLFALQGGYCPEKLAGMYKFMMKIVTKVLIKKISALPNKGTSEEQLIHVLKNGGSFVKEENLQEIAAYLQE